LDRLKKDLKDKRLVIVVGAGVTLNATADTSGRPLPRLTWTGLIRNGLDYLVNDGHVQASNRRIRYAYEALEDSDPASLLDAAGIMANQMTQNGQFPTWLESVFGSLHQEVRYRSLLDVLRALHQEGATLLTTNYDDLLERACDLPRVGRSNQDDILKFKRGDLDGVFHVHGSYHDPHEVVLDNTQYYQVTHADEVQNVLQTFLEYRTIVFVGCGSGLEDPNFGALLKWASERHGNIPNRHCLLIRNGDNLNHKMLVRLKYGPDYSDLARYLQCLLDEPLEPPQDSKLSRTGKQAKHPAPLLN
jgi:SIR2-like domain